MSQLWQRICRFSIWFVAGLTVCLLLNAYDFGILGNRVVAQTPGSNQLVQQGINLYQAGKFTEAIPVWEQALSQPLDSKDKAIVHTNLAQAYRQVGQVDRAIASLDTAIQIYESNGSDANRRLTAKLLAEQAQAYSDLGQHQQAITLLEKAQKIANLSQDPLTEAAASGALGNAYWALGDYQQAITAHQASLKIAREQKNTPYITSALNNLGNVYVARAERYLTQANAANLEGDDPESSALRQLGQEDVAAAEDAFKQSVQESGGGITQVKALLNFNSMLERFQSEPENGATPAKQDLVAKNRAQALGLLEVEPDSQEKAYALINIGDSLKRNTKSPNIQPADQSQIVGLLEKSLLTARNIGSRRAESFALGTLGQVYESAKEYDRAMELTRQAQLAAQQINAADSLYRWQWQAGRILKAQGEKQQAIATYTQAIATLQSIRGDIAASNKELQFNFRDSVEPVYRQLIGLLLDANPSVADARLKAQVSQNAQGKNISKALEVLELLKLAELQNFFGDECVQVALNNAKSEQVAFGKPQTALFAQSKANSAKVAQANEKVDPSLPVQDPNAAVIYSVILDSRSEMILQLGNGSLTTYPVALDDVQMQAEVDGLRSLLEKRSTEEYLLQARKIYDLLIRPMEADLQAAKPSTLVFVNDGVLRKVPMSALHDGKEFLIQKYPIATTPSLSLTAPTPLVRDNLEALIAGLTVARPPFEALPNVGAETARVQKILGGTKLLDQQFTVGNFQEAFDNHSYPIVHLATHGKFGVDSDNTYLLGFDNRISLDEIDRLLRSRGSKQPVELLTLSACQTAAGDNRSALGIAGVAVRAGVKSALATLWFINDESTVPLVEEFYTQLRQPNVTRAEALRRAQVKLIANPNYNHPGVWSPFILIGSWL